MSNADYVKELLLTCPYITNEVGSFDLHIDLLESSAVNYAIESEPNELVVKRYLNGDMVKRFPFSLVARKKTFTDSDRSINSAVFEHVTDWCERESRMRRLPAMDVGKKPQKLSALGCSYLFENDQDASASVYLLQMELQYFQKAY